MDVIDVRQQLVNFFNKSYKQFKRDEFCYYPDKIGYNTDRLSLSSEKLDVLESILFDFFDDVKGSLYMAPFELNVIINNSVSVYMASVKYFTKKVMYLTWRPAEMELNVFKDIVIKLCDKKIIKNYVLVFEQKGSDYSNIGVGKHIHALIKFHYNRPYVEYKKQIKKYFFDTHKQHKKSIDISDIDKPDFIQSKLYYMGYVYSNDELLVNDNLNYKKGNTREESIAKNKCLEYDRLFQQRNKLNDIIENNIQYLIYFFFFFFFLLTRCELYIKY